MRILVTGGSGFIGSHLCEALLARGDEVRVLDDLSTGRLDNLTLCTKTPGFQFTQGDVADTGLLSRLMEGVDWVFHLAASVGVSYVMKDPLRSLTTNVTGVESIFQAAARNRTAVLFASSSEVYGRGVKVPFSEDDDRVLGPTDKMRWCYACAKALGEYLAFAYQMQKSVPVVIVRLFNVCGPRQVGHYGMVIPRFVTQALAGEPITVFGDGEQSRTFGHVSDVIRGMLGLVACPQALGQVVNLGGTETITIGDLARRIKALTGSASPIQTVPYEEAYGEGYEDMRLRTPDLSKAKRLIGYEPKVTLEETLQSVIEEKRAALGRSNA